jgi:hypothetical protein
VRVLVQAGMLVLLKVLGLDIRPLLAAGGLGGIVLGLATQSLLANALAGLHLVSPPCTPPGCAAMPQACRAGVKDGSCPRATNTLTHSLLPAQQQAANSLGLCQVVLVTGPMS